MTEQPDATTEEEAAPKRDWAGIALEYETTPVTLQELSEKYGIPMPTVTWHSAQEGWVGRRQHFLEKTAEEIRRKIRLRYTQEAIRDYDRIEGATIQVVKQIVAGKPVKFVDKDGKVVQFTAMLEANSLDAAANALINLVKAKANLAGVPSEFTKTEVIGDLKHTVRIDLSGMTDDELDQYERNLLALCEGREDEPPSGEGSR